MLNSGSSMDFDVTIDDIKNRLTLDDYWELECFKKRQIFLCEEIDACSVSDACFKIQKINEYDAKIPVAEREPILLYLNTIGGSVTDGFSLIDEITTSSTPVYTINLGYWYSMGFHIGIAGHKRFTMPSATFLLHDGSNAIIDSQSKANDAMEFNAKYNEKIIKEHVVSRTSISEKKFEEKERVEWYMFVEEAKAFGVIDYIIGVDCDRNLNLF